MRSTINQTLDHVLFLARCLNKCDLQRVTIVMLMELGVPTACVGFEYLKRAILLRYEDPTRALSKDIYLDIVLRCRLNSEEQVEQAMREAIKKAWEEGSDTAWNWYFAYDGHGKLNKPTICEFVSRIARILELWQGCSEKEVSHEEE